MIKKKDALFYTRYLQYKFYFMDDKYIKSLFLLEKYLFENFNFNEEIPISNLKYKWIYDCIHNNDYSNEVSKDYKIFSELENKKDILNLIDSFSQIPNLKNQDEFFTYLNIFNNLFNSLLNYNSKNKFKTSVLFQFVLLIYVNKYKVNNVLKNKIDYSLQSLDYFEFILVNIFFKDFNYKISKFNYLVKLLLGFLKR